MLINEFNYSLPKELIAKYPAKKRTASRLLYLDGLSGVIQHKFFEDLIHYIKPKDLLVINNSKVILARLLGHKETGGQVEVMIERLQDKGEALAHIRASKPIRLGTILKFDKNIEIKVLEKEQELFKVCFLGSQPTMQILDAIGHVPLPPYIKRKAEAIDVIRYQTVYAKVAGSVAAPTAGLHFDNDFLAKLRDRGTEIAEVTLHIGAGTFQPVKVENIDDHKMHSEVVMVPKALCDKVMAAKASGGRIIAVGTTAVRALETAALSGTLQPFTGETDMFIKPGFEFKVVDAMLTNFHLPNSTLLMLVCAFGGYANVLRAYREAIRQQYRFYSYGDAMFITKGKDNGI